MKSILLIEDNVDILENLAEHLKLEGYCVFSTNNEQREIEIALEFKPDLVICDMPRPGIGGYEVLRKLINTLSISEIPFIFCTTMCKTTNRSDAPELSADDYIIKPFELDTILQMAQVRVKDESKRQRCTA